MYFGRLFHVSRNAVPVELEPCSNLAGTGVQLSGTKAENIKTMLQVLPNITQVMFSRHQIANYEKTETWFQRFILHPLFSVFSSRLNGNWPLMPQRLLRE